MPFGRSGTVGIAGAKGSRLVNNLPSDHIFEKALNLVGIRGTTWEATENALGIIASGRYDRSKYHTHTYGFDDLELGLSVLGGKVPTEHPVHVAIGVGAS